MIINFYYNILRENPKRMEFLEITTFFFILSEFYIFNFILSIIKLIFFIMFEIIFCKISKIRYTLLYTPKQIFPLNLKNELKIKFKNLKNEFKN